MKYADDLVLLVRGETMLQGVIDRLTEVECYYGTEKSVEKAKVMRISRHLSPLQIMIGQIKPDVV